MTWMTSTWTTLCGVYSWLSHSKQQFVLVGTFWRNLRFTKNEPLKSVKKLVQVTEELIEDQKEINNLTTKSLSGYRHVHYCDKAFEITNAQTFFFADSVLCLGSICDQPTSPKLNGFGKLAISKIRVESMESRWSSSGQFFQDSQHWEFSKRFKNWWLICSVNVSTSKVGSSSCQCTTTLYGENEEMQRNVKVIFAKLRIMLANSLADVGHFLGLGSEKKCYGTYSHKPDWSWDQTAEKKMANFLRFRSSNISCLQCLWERGELRRGLKLVERGQYLKTLDTEEGQKMQHWCWEYTMTRNEKKSRAEGWILKNTRIGPLWNIEVCCRDDRYSIEVQIPSLFEDNTASWVRIVNGVDKYVTESMLCKDEENTVSGWIGEPITKPKRSRGRRGRHLGETNVRRLNTVASQKGDETEASQCCGSQPRSWSTRLRSKKGWWIFFAFSTIWNVLNNSTHNTRSITLMTQKKWNVMVSSRNW